jgi:hypothetical protein
MTWSDDTYITAFDAEAGDISTLATSGQKIIWFNEGLSRLGKRKPTHADITWIAGDRSVVIAASGFVQVEKIVWDEDTAIEPWRVWGNQLIIDDPNGAVGDGGARIYYWGEYTEMTAATTATELDISGDHACMYYALGRFYRKLSSNRAYYKRYATMVGANAVSMTDLQQEADRYYNDFLDARADLEPEPPAFFYPTYE